ncbi:hypothetical protein CBM2599_P160005 [Cupriavidus taiwanensis]|uniref:Uncharacterized protein n=2 Tax=Cupriavidus TaxID=106589 RepID=A0A375HXS3_9BURK|nr:hypothetical protein CBM2585_P160005 [Cupriavidus taiwanensis]SOZ40440.1 hypothetical protein CBM2605_P160004 [Cupriavidus neocaledonicus]SOY99205.1 hypothetical protein CBM2591_P190005 [Cupriavidus taiwanensis]SOZ06796.1 hypothetical protein CBM2599_P160005 [Cupriavidus taiwanensis]SOZ19618.1 hypothetical protein CBM2595_P160005 [Cupriavidus taiwanensis]
MPPPSHGAGGHSAMNPLVVWLDALTYLSYSEAVAGRRYWTPRLALSAGGAPRPRYACGRRLACADASEFATGPLCGRWGTRRRHAACVVEPVIGANARPAVIALDGDNYLGRFDDDYLCRWGSGGGGVAAGDTAPPAAPGGGGFRMADCLQEEANSHVRDPHYGPAGPPLHEQAQTSHPGSCSGNGRHERPHSAANRAPRPSAVAEDATHVAHSFRSVC